MFEMLNEFFRADFMPHGHCYFWKPEIVWLHVISDSLIAAAYYSIPLILLYFTYKRKDLPFPGIFLMFGAFIVACGSTHLMEVWTVWHGDYGVSGLLKAATAGISLTAAVALFKIVPQALSLRSPSELDGLNKSLQVQIIEKAKVEAQLRQAQGELEERVADRTRELEVANERLQSEIVRHEQTLDMLRERDAHYQAIIQTANDAILTVSANLDILSVNSAALRMFEYSAMDALDIRFADLIAGQSRAEFLKSLPDFTQKPVVDSDGSSSLTVYGMRKSGGEFPLEASVSPVTTDKERFFTVIIRDVTERKESELRLRNSLTEKEVLLKEIHHRVKNNLQVISSMLRIQSRYFDDARAQKVYRQSQDRIQSMALIHEMLYKSPDLGRIRFDEYIGELIQMLVRSHGAAASHVEIDIEAQPSNMPVQTAMTLGLILNELATNALKHAFPDSRPGRIRIEWKDDGHENCWLIVQDNGVGWPDDFDWSKAETMGCRLLKILVEQIHGRLETSDTGGVRWVLCISKKTVD